mmetsp:Transcript_68117/g.215509  ORF Transcript_68117/g.215509 Transcript_68117/m.215509 type:complete len:600 (-) Transcript_68117:646-2445(-)
MDKTAPMDGLDEDGKAMFGTPGPGTYQPASSFGKPLVYTAAPTFAFGTREFDLNRQSYISQEHSKTLYGVESPGPTYAPDTKMVKKSAAAFSFGTCERDGERGRYISKNHCRENAGLFTPGPGTYKHKEGKGIAKTMGDAPTQPFPIAAQRDILFEREMLFHPGPGAHDHHTDIGKSPCISFAPRDRAKGARSRKDQDHRVFISELAAKEPSGAKLTGTPGPGEYPIKTTIGKADMGRHIVDTSKAAKTAPAFSFNTAPNFNDMKSKPFISKLHQDPDTCSPGPAYALPSAMNQGVSTIHSRKNTSMFATSPRFFHPEDGGNAAGPIVSKQHSMAALQGFESPGPGAYALREGKGISKSLGDAPTWRFGSEARLKQKAANEVDSVPGPGAYHVKQAAEASGTKGGFSRPSAFSVASCLRSEVVSEEVKNVPGPGAYDTDRGIALKDPRRKKAPTAKFGKDKDRSSFMPGNANPGPGSYDHNLYLVEGVAPGMSFGVRHVTYDTGLGPGPGAYKKPEGKGIAKSVGDAPTWKFGTGRRGNDKVFISKLAAAPDPATPGPGAYAPDSGWSMSKASNSNRFPNKGGYSFGNSRRAPLATVKF